MLLAATMLKVGANPSLYNSPGVVINTNQQNFVSARSVLHLLSLMTDHTRSMKVVIDTLRNHEQLQEMDRTMEKEDFRAKTWKAIVASFLIGSGIIIGVAFAKRFQGGK